MHAEIYSTPTCGRCVMVKNVLKTKNIPFTEYTVGRDVEKSELESRIGFSINSVPQIFINNEYIKNIEEFNLKIAEIDKE